MKFVIETEENGFQVIMSVPEEIQLLTADNSNFTDYVTPEDNSYKDCKAVLLWDDFDFESDRKIGRKYYFYEGDKLTIAHSKENGRYFEF